MTADPVLPHPSVPGPATVAAPRPAGVVAALVVVLTHAVLLVGGTVASVVNLLLFGLSHPGVRWGPALLVPLVLNAVAVLVLAAADIVLVVRLWKAAGWARVALTVCLGLSAALTLGGLVSASAQPVPLNAPVVALQVVEVLLCVSGVVLVWVPTTSAWLRSRSER